MKESTELYIPGAGCYFLTETWPCWESLLKFDLTFIQKYVIIYL